jgi:Ca2+/Na+ antiporter
METIINQLASNPVYFAVAVVFVLVILFGVIKKLIKLVIFSAVVFAIWIAYLVYTDKEIPTTIQEAKESIIETIDRGKQKGEELLEKKVGEQVDKIFNSD